MLTPLSAGIETPVLTPILGGVSTSVTAVIHRRYTVSVTVCATAGVRPFTLCKISMKISLCDIPPPLTPTNASITKEGPCLVAPCASPKRHCNGCYTVLTPVLTPLSRPVLNRVNTTFRVSNTVPYSGFTVSTLKHDPWALVPTPGSVGTDRRDPRRVARPWYRRRAR